jgi:hypothetical protein
VRYELSRGTVRSTLERAPWYSPGRRWAPLRAAEVSRTAHPGVLSQRTQQRQGAENSQAVVDCALAGRLLVCAHHLLAKQRAASAATLHKVSRSCFFMAGQAHLDLRIRHHSAPQKQLSLAIQLLIHSLAGQWCEKIGQVENLPKAKNSGAVWGQVEFTSRSERESGNWQTARVLQGQCKLPDLRARRICDAEVDTCSVWRRGGREVRAGRLDSRDQHSQHAGVGQK